MKCSFCNKTFSNKYVLKTHMECNKKCISARGLDIPLKYVCKSCNHISTRHNDFQVHLTNCTKYMADLQKEIYDKKLKELEQKYQEMIVSRDNTITKLEITVSSLQKTISDIALQTDTYSINRNTGNVPIPLHEQMDSIFNDDVKDDENDIVCSEITINGIVIISRPIDHYIDATQLCKAGEKKFEDWLCLDSTKEFIKEIESIKGIPSSLLVETNKGETSRFRRGSWIHPDLLFHLASWLSSKIAVQVTSWLRTLFKETLDIDIHLLREKERDLRLKDKRIKQLENVCLSKQRRVDYQEHNVIYLLTTDDHLSRRTYIIGKAKNLKTRLSTYNKTCDHTVVYYRQCKNEDDMSTAETMILSKLHAFREQANRDRFILPEDRDVSFFTQTIDECIRFLA